MNQKGLLNITQAPQYFNDSNTAKLSATLLFALLPTLVWSLVFYGYPALLIVASALLTSFSLESLINKRLAKKDWAEANWLLSGLMTALLLPPLLPLPMVILATAFGVVVGKWVFGGTGAYILSPPLAAWLFVYLNWPDSLLNSYQMPGDYSFAAYPDAFSVVRTWLSDQSVGAGGLNPAEILERSGIAAYSPTNLDLAGSQFLNDYLFSNFSVSLPQTYIDPFLGFSPNTLGSTSGLLLLFSSVILFSGKNLAWHAPLSAFFSFSLFLYVFGGLPFGLDFGRGDLLFSLFRGSFLFVLFYLLSDTTLVPYSNKARLVYGLFLGSLAALFQLLSFSAYAPLMALCFLSPFLWFFDRFFRHRRFSAEKKS